MAGLICFFNIYLYAFSMVGERCTGTTRRKDRLQEEVRCQKDQGQRQRGIRVTTNAWVKPSVMASDLESMTWSSV